jgi:hypothetical protein
MLTFHRLRCGIFPGYITRITPNVLPALVREVHSAPSKEYHWRPRRRVRLRTKDLPKQEILFRRFVTLF